MTEVLIKQRKPDFFENDLSEDRFRHYSTKTHIAIDTETRGLNIPRDRLCLVQICDEDGFVSLVRYKQKIDRAVAQKSNLRRLLEHEKVLKIFHFARFDLAVLKYYLGAEVAPFWCTKIASKLVRTYTDRHSLKDLVRELLKLEMDKSDQTSDWARDDLSDSQLAYAANDVRVLIPIYHQLHKLLEREGRLELAERIYQCLPVICELDLHGWKDIFEH